MRQGTTGCTLGDKAKREGSNHEGRFVRAPGGGYGQADNAARTVFNGLGPIRRGHEGVERAVAELADEGWYLVKGGTEITMKSAAGIRTRVDAVLQRGDEYLVLEAKNGRYARLTRNQQAAFDSLNAGGALLPVGRRAAEAGLDLPIANYRIVQYW